MINDIFLNNSTVVIYSGEKINGYEHLKYWIPEFLKAKVIFTVMVRNKELFDKIKNEYRIVNIYYAKSSYDVDQVLSKLNKLKTIFYLSNTANNIHVLAFNEYKHIFIGTENFDRDAQVTQMLKAYEEK